MLLFNCRWTQSSIHSEVAAERYKCAILYNRTLQPQHLIHTMNYYSRIDCMMEWAIENASARRGVFRSCMELSRGADDNLGCQWCMILRYIIARKQYIIITIRDKSYSWACFYLIADGGRSHQHIARWPR